MKEADDILDILENSPVDTKLEILANVLLKLGYTRVEYPQSDNIGLKEVLESVALHKKQYGEDVYTAMITQAMSMLIWVSEFRK